jgi:RNA polymerase sigma-70 factor (sigma-E family)
VTVLQGEANLVTRAGREEFTRWARARQGHLLRASLLLTGDRQRAEDLVQEALTKVAMRWDRLRTTNPDAYARAVMYHDSVSWWRKRRHEVLGAYDVEAGAAAPEPERRILLLEALRALTPRQRAVIVLRYFEDLTEQQVAALLGISVGTVKSQAHKALTHLREACGDLTPVREREPR